MTFVFTFFIIIRRRAIIECALVIVMVQRSSTVYQISAMWKWWKNYDWPPTKKEITLATNKSSLARFRKKFPSDPFLIWQICKAMSANDLINCLGANSFKMAVKWPFWILLILWYLLNSKKTRFAWGAKLASPPATHSTLIIVKYSTVTKFLCKPRENVISESH